LKLRVVLEVCYREPAKDSSSAVQMVQPCTNVATKSHLFRAAKNNILDMSNPDFAIKSPCSNLFGGRTRTSEQHGIGAGPVRRRLQLLWRTLIHILPIARLPIFLFCRDVLVYVVEFV